MLGTRIAMKPPRQPSLKTLCKRAILTGDTEQALTLLKQLENPKPKRLRKEDMPYRLPFIIV
jgi:hypothetical protein